MQRSLKIHLVVNPAAVINHYLYDETNGTLEWLKRHKRFGIILAGIITLNLAYGFDPRFTIINLLWIFISVAKIK